MAGYRRHVDQALGEFKKFHRISRPHARREALALMKGRRFRFKRNLTKLAHYRKERQAQSGKRGLNDLAMDSGYKKAEVSTCPNWRWRYRLNAPPFGGRAQGYACPGRVSHQPGRFSPGGGAFRLEIGPSS